jgi:hypothetical protein
MAVKLRGGCLIANQITIVVYITVGEAIADASAGHLYRYPLNAFSPARTGTVTQFSRGGSGQL